MVTSLLALVVWIVVVALIIGLLIWLVDNLGSMLQPPFRQLLRTLIIVVGVIIVIVLLLDFLGLVGRPIMPPVP